MSKFESIMFGVGCPEGKHSPVWQVLAKNRFKAGSAKSDIYIQCHSLRGWLKTSLHESGRWHDAIPSDKTAKDPNLARIAGDRRFIDTWERPAPQKPGHTIAYRILVLANELVEQPDPSLPANTIWHPVPPRDHAVEYAVFIAHKGISEIQIKPREGANVQILGSIPLHSGESVVVASSITSVSDWIMSSIREHHRKLMETFPAGKPGDPERRVMLGIPMPDGSRAVVETPMPLRTWLHQP